MLLEHNIPVYEKLEETLSKSKLAIVVTFTGTGKSYIANEYVERHGYKALVVVPSDAIKDQWSGISDNISVVTYQWLTNHVGTIIELNAYDCYIIDEAHHAGANRWGVPIRRIIKELDKPVIGLTADPVRYSDEFKDVSKDIWKDNVVLGYDIIDALEKGLIPKIRYIYALFDKTGIVEGLPDGVTQELRGALEYSLNNIKSVQEILHSYIAGTNRKCIVFVDNISRVGEAINLIEEVFPHEPIWHIHNKKRKNDIALEEFAKSDKGFMVAVNMLNEGVHIPGVDTIIMLRRTLSPSIFYQQIGRAVSTGKPEGRDILLFDLVGNNFNMINIDSRIKSLTENIDELIDYSNRGVNRRRANKISEQFIVDDYTGDVYNILHQIKLSLSNRWQDWEDDILREYYPEYGADKCMELLPHRSRETICGRVKRLKVKRVLYTWQDWEDDILREYYPEYGADKCMELLPHRSRKAICGRSNVLRLEMVSNIWQEWEDDILREYYPEYGADKCMELLPNRNRQAILARASKLNIGRNERCGSWEEWEDEIMREYYPKYGPDKCVELIQRRTRGAVITRAGLLGLYFEDDTLWQEWEDDILREYYPEHGINKCMEMIPGRDKTSIYNRVRRMKIKRVIYGWQEWEDDILREYYPEHGINKCMEMLPDRDKKTVVSRVNVLKLKKISDESWQEWEDDILREYYPEYGADKCAELLPRRTVYAVKARVRILNIKMYDSIINRRKWEEWEDDILREYYPEYGADKCMELLPHRSRNAIITRVHALNKNKKFV